MSYKTLIRLFCLFMLSGKLTGIEPVQAQTPVNDSVHFFLARIIDYSERSPIAFAHVVNKSTGRGNITDTLGFFTVHVSLNDVLQISAIGYGTHSIEVTDSLLHSGIIPVIYLVPRAYDIETVDVNPLGTYRQFKYKMLNLELPETRQMNPVLKRKIEMGMDTLDIAEPMSLGSPVTAIYNLLSREGKEKRKYSAILRQEALEEQYLPKYNREIVGRATGLKGVELNMFMEFCNFDPAFLIASTEYEITAAVLECFHRWKERKGENESSE